MVVFRDLLEYQSGVYESDHNMDQIVGGHAVVLEGFGVEDGLEFWLVRNSWGPDWGQDGYLKVLVGNSYLGSQGAFACEPY